MSAKHVKAAVELLSVKRSAGDPKRPLQSTDKQRGKIFPNCYDLCLLAIAAKQEQAVTLVYSN
jgi:hypothetical protein